MTLKVGIPRALLYYNFYPQWVAFFQRLGVETVVSGKTTKGLLEKGLRATVDEACLPVKLAVGHVIALKDEVDYLFLPRLVSIARREYVCPKFLGFPDMVRHTIPDLPPLIDHNWDLYKKNSSSWQFFYGVGNIFTRHSGLIKKAYLAGVEAMERHLKARVSGDRVTKSGLVIAVLGHPYNLYDEYISMNLLDRLREQGVTVLTADDLPAELVCRAAMQLPKKLFWTLNQRMIGAAYHYLEHPRVHGLIHVASFGCGPDSMTGELIERFVRGASSKPLLNLTLDEHTGEAGIITRLEAFLDMVRWRFDLADVAVTR